MHQCVGMDRSREIILEAARKMERIFRGDIFDAFEQFGIAAPADFDTAEQVGFRARHLEKPLRLEGGLRTENFRVRLETNAGTASVADLAKLFQLALRFAALEGHLVEL